MILFFAKFIMMHAEDINDKVTLIKYAILSAIPLALIIVEPNLSTTICTALVICLMIYIGGLSYKSVSYTHLVGEQVVTSHVSDRFLQGLFIGYISEVEVDSNNLTRSGYITPAVDFSKLQEVLVITTTKQEMLDAKDKDSKGE